MLAVRTNLESRSSSLVNWVLLWIVISRGQQSEGLAKQLSGQGLLSRPSGQAMYGPDFGPIRSAAWRIC